MHTVIVFRVLSFTSLLSIRSGTDVYVSFTTKPKRPRYLSRDTAGGTDFIFPT